MITTSETLRCAICDGGRWIRLPEIGPYSMASDWRVLNVPLRKCACAGCGVVRSCDPPANADMFVRDYTLYAHPPTDPRERQRQEQYATWIARSVQPYRPRRILEVGCGNGSLLLALGEHWREAMLMGCDLSVDSVKHGRDAGMTLWPLPATDLPADIHGDIVLTVNVIEHAVDPLSFLDSLRQRVTPDGLLVVICPDGDKVDVELLIADHAHSFARPHLENLLVRAGFAPRLWAAAPEALGAFQMVIAEPHGSTRVPRSIDAHAHAVQQKAAYLQRWGELDQRLLVRLGQRPVTCFGMGEAAGLLRAYAPAAWSQVRARTADRLVDSVSFGALPMVPLENVPTDQTLLVAVRSQDQPRVADALRRRFTNVVTWYDLVAGDAT
jgi:SAM-dependent methyltransferase